MKLRIAAVILAMSATHARAQWVVVDPTLNTTALATFGKAALSEAHELQVGINTAQTVITVAGVLNATAHGNFMGLTSLAPLLGAQGMTDPLGPGTSAGLSDVFQGVSSLGSMSGQVTSLMNQASSLTNHYSTTGTDWSAAAMLRQARALAGQMATSQRYMDSSATRLQTIPLLNAAASATTDVKSSVDAGNTLLGQQITQSAQTNQLLSMQIQQQAQQANEKNLADQEWRRSTDGLQASAQRAADYSKAGNVGWTAP